MGEVVGLNPATPTKSTKDTNMNNNYKAFFNAAKKFLGNRIYDDYLYRFALGSDASCYRYTPKLIIRAQNENEIIKIIALADKFNLPITFRASGSSLSGQALSDSILVIATNGFEAIKINGENILLDCGVIGSSANAALKNKNKKIGPDPATITMARMGGIIANNSSGMCCGVKQNSYSTIKSIRVILSDGFLLDTSDKNSINDFLATHKYMVESILDLRREILADSQLCKLIKKKYKIKNTTGYSLNALVDFENIIDILNHIFVGSEGTLGFISRVELECVDDSEFKACFLLFYENMNEATNAIIALQKYDNIIQSAEIMDYACLKSVQNIDGLPESIHKITHGNACILLQSEAKNEKNLAQNIDILKQIIQDSKPKFSESSTDENIYNTWWKIRKGLLPIIAGNRAQGSSVITEDICFEIENLGRGVEMVEKLFEKYDFSGIIFGHALSGNIHFIITPNLDDRKQRENFAKLVDELAKSVSAFGGSIKAEHGTGRMMAPFVEIEWGQKAYEINRAIKNIFDKKNIFNKDCIITDDKNLHTKNLKEMTQIEDFIDKCMECGFCEKACPSNALSLSPRQRIAAWREMQRLKNLGDKNSLKLYKQMKKAYKYAGDELCAACSMCKTLCPIEINTAQIALNLRQNDNFISKHIAKHFGFYLNLGKHALNLAKMKFPNLPNKNNFKLKNTQDTAKQSVIYFSTCMNRALNNHKNGDERSMNEVFYNLCKKAGFNILIPPNLENLCCGKAFINNPNAHKILMQNIRQSLSQFPREIPIVCDHSACSWHLIENLGEFNIYDLPNFILDFLAPKLSFQKIAENINIYPVCALKKHNQTQVLINLAKLCVEGELILDEHIFCCGFAGNKGFLSPELNAHALKNNKFKNARGFSSSLSCEIGLNTHTNTNWQHIIYLIDEASNAR